MADYKFALKLHQDKAGSENAKAKITIGGNVVAAELEITPESAAIYTYDVTGLADENSNGSVTTLVKVELLNDYFVDTDNDRNIIWSACGYVQKNSDGNYYSNTDTTDDNWSSSTQSTPEVISDFTEDASFNWAEGGPKTGDANGDDGDYSTGWTVINISATFVQATVRLMADKAVTYVDNS
jgi:hypothetical protein|tara:strand:+ start:291 stop:836 length:546 start_codon:yes stop_codon:yes gene_type:complete